jgi:outer membrane protein OmpA-like peptidoglycan-associated protein
MPSKINFIAAIALCALAGCAETAGTKTNTQGDSTGTASAQTPATAGKPATAAPAPTPQAPAVRTTIADDGTVAEFDPQGIELSNNDLVVIANLIDTASKAHSIEITGYCDKKDADKNAKKIAHSRAAAVKNEMVKHGVSAMKIHTKYITNVARHAVVVVFK